MLIIFVTKTRLHQSKLNVIINFVAQNRYISRKNDIEKRIYFIDDSTNDEFVVLQIDIDIFILHVFFTLFFSCKNNANLSLINMIEILTNIIDCTCCK